MSRLFLPAFYQSYSQIHFPSYSVNGFTMKNLPCETYMYIICIYQLPIHNCLLLFILRLSLSTSSCPWLVDKKKVILSSIQHSCIYTHTNNFSIIIMQFAIQLLGLATLSLQNDMASPFQICGVVAPKLV